MSRLRGNLLLGAVSANSTILHEEVNKLMQFSKSILFAAVALIAPLAMNADSINAPSSLALGNLMFSNFTCTNSNSGGPTATPSGCSQINLATITAPGNGIQFSTGFIAAKGAFEDATLGYSVSSASGITNVGLLFNGYFEGLAVTSVTETVLHGSDVVGSLKVSCGVAGCTSSDKYENIVLNGSYTNLNIQKDIQLNSFGSTYADYAGLSFVDQTFTTGPVINAAATPEPASLALIGLGLLAVGAVRRRMVKA